jgi:hypothetical protein
VEQVSVKRWGGRGVCEIDWKNSISGGCADRKSTWTQEHIGEKRMPILVRHKGEKWQKANDVEFADEAELQKMLYEGPEPVSLRDEHPAVFIREAGLPGSGRTDLLGVDADGNILIVETKLF